MLNPPRPLLLQYLLAYLSVHILLVLALNASSARAAAAIGCFGIVVVGTVFGVGVVGGIR